MHKIKTPLAWLTGLFGLSFMDGFLSLGLNDDVYALMGFGMIGILIWMWVVVSKTE